MSTPTLPAMAERPHDPFSPAARTGPRPLRSTADESIPDWLLDEMRARDVSDDQLDAAQATFAGFDRSERAKVLAGMALARSNAAELDALAESLREHQSSDEPSASVLVVPKNATDVLTWLAEPNDAHEARARALAALDVEAGYSAPRKTVLTAIGLIVGDDVVADGLAERG